MVVPEAIQMLLQTLIPTEPEQVLHGIETAITQILSVPIRIGTTQISNEIIRTETIRINNEIIHIGTIPTNSVTMIRIVQIHINKEVIIRINTIRIRNVAIPIVVQVPLTGPRIIIQAPEVVEAAVAPDLLDLQDQAEPGVKGIDLSYEV